MRLWNYKYFWLSSSKIGLFTYFNVEVNIMNERRVTGVVVDAGHGGIGVS